LETCDDEQDAGGEDASPGGGTHDDGESFDEAWNAGVDLSTIVYVP